MSRAVFPLQVGFYVVTIEQDITKFAICIHFCLIVKMRGFGIALQAANCNGFGS